MQKSSLCLPCGAPNALMNLTGCHVGWMFAVAPSTQHSFRVNPRSVFSRTRASERNKEEDHALSLDRLHCWRNRKCRTDSRLDSARRFYSSVFVCISHPHYDLRPRDPSLSNLGDYHYTSVVPILPSWGDVPHVYRGRPYLSRSVDRRDCGNRFGVALGWAPVRWRTGRRSRYFTHYNPQPPC